MQTVLQLHILQRVCKWIGQLEFDTLCMVRTTCAHARSVIPPPNYACTREWSDYMRALDNAMSMSESRCAEYAVDPQDLEVGLWYPPWHVTSALFDTSQDVAMCMHNFPLFAPVLPGSQSKIDNSQIFPPGL